MERLKTSPGQGIEDGRLNGILEDPGTGKKMNVKLKKGAGTTNQG